MTETIELSFPLNQALFEEAEKIKNERLVIKERLAKIEAKKNEVTPTVYQKVKQDYLAKLNEATNALLQKKTDVDKELSGLYETRSRVSENYDQNKEELEELKFRQTLDEFSEEEFKKIAAEREEKIEKFEKVLNAINSNIEKYEALFADDEGGIEPTDASIRIPKPAKKKEKAPIKEATDYEIPSEEEEGEYFAPEEAKEAPLNLGESSVSVTDVTKKTAIPTGEARVIIIEGELAGQEFKLKKENTIGRANTNMIVLKDAKVSRQHSVIKKTGNEFVILDLNSSNGIVVNHEKVKEHVLGDGDQVQIGDHTFQFKIS